jgi:uncharacterized protein (TIGR02145 family)
MVENLKTTKYRNGTTISNVTDNTAWSKLTTGVYCWYNNDISNKTTYGALYNWYAVSDSRNIAPVGWHVATDADWSTLTTYLGGITVAGGKMKETGTTHWLSPNTGATNESGFNALPAGLRSYLDSPFINILSFSYFWSSNQNDVLRAWSYRQDSNSAGCTRYDYPKQGALSVRCVKD